MATFIAYIRQKMEYGFFSQKWRGSPVLQGFGAISTFSQFRVAFSRTSALRSKINRFYYLQRMQNAACEI
jgi:hypothetical protein